MANPHPVSPEEWLGLWRRLWFDLPLELAGGQASLDAAPEASIVGALVQRDAVWDRSPVDAQAPGLGREGSDEDRLEELQMGCFA